MKWKTDEGYIPVRLNALMKRHFMMEWEWAIRDLASIRTRLLMANEIPGTFISHNEVSAELLRHADL